jgi:hypothetical protein
LARRFNGRLWNGTVNVSSTSCPLASGRLTAMRVATSDTSVIDTAMFGPNPSEPT